MVVAVAGVHRVMGELGTAVDKAGKAIAEGKAQLKKNVEKVGSETVTGASQQSVLRLLSGCSS